MKLAHHFMMERKGYETREARRIKFFARNWYYKKMADYYKKPGEDPAIGLKIARHLELADREARNAERICPLGNGQFRHFLLAFDGQAQLDQRLRLMREAIHQVRVAAKDLNFSVMGPWMLGFCVEVAKAPPEELPSRHAVVTFETRTERMLIPPPCPWYSLSYDLVGVYPQPPSEREIRICTDVSVSLTPPLTPRTADVELARTGQSHQSVPLESVASGR